MTKKNNKNKKKNKITFITILQSTYLTGSFFIRNDLLSYSSACTFGFLFSLIPTIMIVLTILLRFLHASPETVINLISELDIFSSTVNIEDMVNKILSVRKITSFEIVLGIGIIWMSRRFFSSVMAGMNLIYKQAVKTRPVFSQIIILAGEAILIVVASVFIFSIITFNTIRETQGIKHLLNLNPVFYSVAVKRFVAIFPYAAIFIIVTSFYKEMNIGNPSWKNSAFSSALCTLFFWLFQLITGAFFNANTYNIVYGVFSKVVVLLLQVSFFFVFFFYFAQKLFVWNFFDELLLGELYLLPHRDNTSLFPSIKRMLFIRPDYLLQKNSNVIRCKKGQVIYRTNEQTNDIYYIARGTVQIVSKNNMFFAECGDFFGEQACVLNDTRNEDATACTDVELIKIDSKAFISLLEKNPAAAKKVLSKISSYYEKIYSAEENN